MPSGTGDPLHPRGGDAGTPRPAGRRRSTRGRSRRRPEAHEPRAPTPGWYFALARYSDSICQNREAHSRTGRHTRSTGPAPSRSPRAKTLRKTAKFSDTRRHPSRAAAPSGRRPSARRRRSPSRGRGASGPGRARRCPTARSAAGPGASPSGVAAEHDHGTGRPRGSPKRPSAIEKPRSTSPSRQRSARSPQLCQRRVVEVGDPVAGHA